MTGWLVSMVYFGGIFAHRKRKIGFWERVCWPFELGERLAEYAWRAKP